MYHSITFGDGTLYPAGHPKEGQFAGVNTWDDWHLIPSERPSVASPGVTTNFVTIPGRDGSIDMTNYLVNRPVFSDRSGSFEFIVDNGHEYWETIRMKIMSFLHGKRMKMVLEDDPNWYWEGRFSVDSWKSEASNSKITINYAVGPYKKRISSDGLTDTIWDPFNFETDYDYYLALNSIELSGQPYQTEFQGGDCPSPVFVDATVASGNQIVATLNGSSTTITSSGTVQIGKSIQGTNTLSLTGNGTVTVHFTGGSL
jgi:hypothetical protein